MGVVVSCVDTVFDVVVMIGGLLLVVLTGKFDVVARPAVELFDGVRLLLVVLTGNLTNMIG